MNEEIVLNLRRSGKGYNEISRLTGLTKNDVGYICRRNGLGGFVAGSFPLTETQVAAVVDQAGFEYVSGYSATKKPITVRCRQCGRTFDRQYHIFSEVVKGTWQCANECPLCRLDKQQAERDQKEANRKAEQERDAQERAQRKAEQLSRQVSDQLIRRLATRVCKNCGKEFCIELSDYNSEIYCSEQCQKRNHDRIKRDKRIRRMKAREIDPDITLEKLFNRDSGICYLCGNKCNWEDWQTIDGQFVAGESYPSVDHVKPISKGGTHTWNNIKLACRHCNTIKGWR